MFGVGVVSNFIGTSIALGEGQGNGDDDEVDEVVIVVADVASGVSNAADVVVSAVDSGCGSDMGSVVVVVSVIDVAPKSRFEVEPGGSTGGGEGERAGAAAATIGCGSSFNSLFIMLMRRFV